METRQRSGYPSDVSDEEWAFVAPYLTLCKPDAEQRGYPLRAVFNAVRYVVRGGIPWRMMPNDLPPWPVVYQQMRRWMEAGCFRMMVEDPYYLESPFSTQNRYNCIARGVDCKAKRTFVSKMPAFAVEQPGNLLPSLPGPPHRELLSSLFRHLSLLSPSFIGILLSAASP
jgi:hypothetical protein